MTTDLPAAFPTPISHEGHNPTTEIRGCAWPERDEWLSASSDSVIPLHRAE